MIVADELKTRIEVVEKSYEFFLAYAAQGVSGEQALKSSGQVRDFLEQLQSSLPKLADLFSGLLAERGITDQECYRAFIDVLRRDAGSSLAAVQLVLAQPVVSSQMIDNLNALIHLRALLTDVFLIDEILNQSLPGVDKTSVD